MARQVRLLLKYHDALQVIAQREFEVDNGEGLPCDSEELDNSVQGRPSGTF